MISQMTAKAQVHLSRKQAELDDAVAVTEKLKGIFEEIRRLNNNRPRRLSELNNTVYMLRLDARYR